METQVGEDSGIEGCEIESEIQKLGEEVRDIETQRAETQWIDLESQVRGDAYRVGGKYSYREIQK